MGTLSPLTATVVGAVLSLTTASPALAQTAVAKAQPEIAVRGAAVPFKARTIGGFRMEGAPEVEVVFGDIKSYRKRIDRFFEIESKMQSTRKRFSQRVQASLAVLVASKRGCPTDALAPQYYAAHANADEYRRLGIDFEIAYTLIRTLDRYGETQGLTPDYRWKVNRVTKTYRSALSDYREMQLALVDQLDKELHYRGCRTSALLTLGEKSKEAALVSYSAPVPPPKRSWRSTAPKPVVPAKTVTFFVDNRSCDSGLDAYADGMLLGEVPARQRSAFQTLAGNHAVCFIAKNDGRRCGDSGTVRTAYIHDGWSMTLHCRKDETTSK